MVTVDCFPARVESPHGVINGARVLIVDDRLLLFTRDKSDVHLTHTATVAARHQEGGGRRTRHTVTDGDGNVWRFSQNGVCPCGSPFKRVGVNQLLAMA